MSHNNPRKKKAKKRPAPLIPPPHASLMKSRKRARQVTTLFHKLTREKDLALRQDGSKANKIVQELDEKIKAIGGREAYQQASQLSTSFHSTSKWVLGYLQRNGWLYGVPQALQATDSTADKTIKSKRKQERRETKLLEVGAINTELLDAADRTVDANNNDSNEKAELKKKYRLDVRAIDLHSMHPGRIEETDFLKLSVDEEEARYDVIVNSMVLNCVTTPEDRGEMLVRLFQFLRPGGILFLTIPRLCLNQSPFIDRDQFLKMLGGSGVGFEMVETRESPKVAFFVCRRPMPVKVDLSTIQIDTRWTLVKRLRREKKYRNQFTVVLKKERCIQARRNLKK